MCSIKRKTVKTCAIIAVFRICKPVNISCKSVELYFFTVFAFFHSVCLLLFFVGDYVFNIAIEEAAEVVYCLSGDGFVVLQTVEQTAADAEFVNKLISGYAFAFQRLIKGVKGNQSTVPPKKSALNK